MTYTAAAPVVSPPALKAAKPRKAATTATPATPSTPAAGTGPMELRRFTAPTMSACLSQVKAELGSAAVILATRNVETRKLLGLVKRSHVEITAGRGIRNPRQRMRRQLRPEAAAPKPKPAGSDGFLQTEGAATAAYLGMQQEVGQLRGLVNDLVTQVQNSRTPHLPDDACPLFRRLIDAGVSQPLANSIMTAAMKRHQKEGGDLEAVARDVLAARLTTTGPSKKTTKGRPHVIALVGPTGVGKTTTIAKLAANLKLRDNARVALVTIDTYRIAAIDQLQKYADIIDAPLGVVSEVREVGDAIARVADYDYVLVDTAGRSPRDAVRLAELSAFLEAANPAETHLVLSANLGRASLELAMKRFAGVRADRLCFTKLDEAAEVGALLDVATACDLPLSYLATGQDVPADIESAEATKLADMILTSSDTPPAKLAA